jgi:hypothetical protein
MRLCALEFDSSEAQHKTSADELAVQFYLHDSYFFSFSHSRVDFE